VKFLGVSDVRHGENRRKALHFADVFMRTNQVLTVNLLPLNFPKMNFVNFMKQLAIIAELLRQKALIGGITTLDIFEAMV
jgi:hypothetical protein